MHKARAFEARASSIPPPGHVFSATELEGKLMSFAPLVTVTKVNKPPHASLSYRPFRRKDMRQKDSDLPRLLVHVPTSVVVSDAKYFQLLVGSKENAGKMRLIGLNNKDAVGVAKASTLKYVVRLNFGYVPTLGTEIFDDYEAPIVKVDVDTYELDVGKLFGKSK
jgi:hypothetical protein